MSAESKAKVEKAERLQARAHAIMAQYPQGLPTEKDEEVGLLIAEVKGLKADIETERKLEAKHADLQDLDKWLNEPERKIPHGINGDGDDRKALLGAGWEIKGGVCYAPTSLGKLQPMFPEEVFFGAIPDDNDATATYYKQTRAAAGAEYKAAYGHFLANTARMGDPGLAMNRLSLSEQKALSEGSDPAGGFLVPVDLQAEVLVRVAQQAVMRKYARVVTTNRDKVSFPAVAPNTSNGSIYSSGFVGSWAGETPAFTDTDPSFQRFEVEVKKLRVSTKLSNDFINDSAVNITAWLAQNAADNMALTEDFGFLLGRGTSLEPLGILNAGIATVDVEGSTSNTISNTTSNTGSAPKVIDLTYALPSQYRSRANWLMCNAIAGKLYKLTDAQGRFYWPELSGSGYAGAQDTLMRRPLDYSDFMPTDGTDGNQVFLFGDLSQYVIAQRAAMTSLVLRERFADTDQVGVIFWERVGGALWNLDACRVGVV